MASEKRPIGLRAELHGAAPAGRLVAADAPGATNTESALPHRSTYVEALDDAGSEHATRTVHALPKTESQ